MSHICLESGSRATFAFYFYLSNLYKGIHDIEVKIQRAFLEENIDTVNDITQLSVFHKKFCVFISLFNLTTRISAIINR